MTDKINLDGILGEKPDEPESIVTSNGSTESLPMVPFVGEKEQPTDEVGVAATAGSSLEELYDKNQVLVYLVDVSSSMCDRVVGDSQVEHFVWSEDSMEAIRTNAEDNLTFAQNITAAGVALEAVQATSEMAMKWARISELMEVDKKGVLGFPSTEEGLMLIKTEVLRLALHAAIALTPNYVKMRKDLPSKIDLVKQLAGEMIEDRFKKYPEADIRAFSFREWPGQLIGHNKDELLAAIRNLVAAGGTNIMAGIAAVLQSLKHSPSKMNLHHIVLVTDAEDAGKVHNIGNEVQTFLDFGIVLDFLHFTQPEGSRYWRGYDATEVLKKVCEATGGEYVRVSTAGEFRSRFMIASQRLCLPAPVDS